MNVKNYERTLRDYAILADRPLDAIVVEGYDGVGKGKVLDLLSEMYGVIPYRPDYNLWQKYDHRNIDRWKISGFFWDVFSHFKELYGELKAPMLFDRGVISGAVYNDDDRIAADYMSILRNAHVLHILVTCSESDYYKFQRSRGASFIPYYQEYRDYTDRYIQALTKAGLPWMIYENSYDEEESIRLASTCRGCGHYSYGWCRHPDMNCRIDGDAYRCEKSGDMEVQDRNGNEMQCV